MDTVLQAQFARIDVALGTLIESITTYNPDPEAAVALLAADDQLTEGLDQLSQHQSNHARIHSLRAQTTALESQLKASVTTLANLRREILDTPTTTAPTNSRAVPLRELLTFARNIASHTVPPSHREPLPADNTEADNKDKLDGEANTSKLPSTTAATPALPNPAEPTDQTGSAAPAPDAQNDTTTQDDPPTLTITNEQAEFIRRMNEPNGWTPWPSSMKVISGNLMRIQAYLLDFEKDPWDPESDVSGAVDPAKDTARIQEEQEARDKAEKEKEEQERRRVAAQQQQQQGQAQQQAQQPARRESVLPPQEQMQFHGFDFEDD